MRLAFCLALFAVGLSGCPLNGGQEQGIAPASAPGGDPHPFRPCKAGPQGGGYHIRAFGISCAAVARVLPGLREYSPREPVTRRRVRDPDAGNELVGEAVHRSPTGWTCLVQGLPKHLVNLILCTRGRQVILYRFA
jgi:hypothetical protein